MLTKLLPPRPGSGVIERPRLKEERTLAREVRLTTLVAPGGFGKSTLAASWMAAWHDEGVPCAWLGLEPEDDEPLRFMLYLAHALARLHPDVGRTVLSLLSTPVLMEPRPLVDLLINDLARRVEEAVLLLDDYHCIEDPAIHELMGYFLAHAPAGLHLVVMSRTVPPLPVSRLRAMSQLLEITATELRFDADEAHRILTGSVQTPLTPQQLEQLQSDTGGWPAALRIAALSPPQSEGPRQGHSRPAPQFADLLDDALARLPPPTLLFMAQTSIAERLSPELCDALTGRHDSAATLASLVHGALLVEPLDAQGHRLRYHQLLGDYLRGPVTERLGLDPRPLHLRAARWFAGQEQWTDAVRHALAAGDTAQAVEWMARCGLEMVYRGDLLTLLSWRRQFPAELMRDRFELKLAVAWGLTVAVRAQDALRMADELAQDAQRVQDPGLSAMLASHVAVLRASVPASQDDSATALALLDHCDLSVVDHWTAESANSVRRFGLWKSGRREEALQVAPAEVPTDNPGHLALGLLYRSAICGQICLELAQLRLAEQHADTADRLARQHGDEPSIFHAVGVPMMAAVMYESGELQAAAARVLPLLPLVDNVAWLDGALQAYLTLARVDHALGKAQEALAWLHRADLLGESKGWLRLSSGVLAQRLMWLAQAGQLAEARACLERLERLASGQPTSGCALADLAFYRDWAAAVLAWFDGRRPEARSLFARLHREASASDAVLRTITLGIWLAQAEVAQGNAGPLPSFLDPPGGPDAKRQVWGRSQEFREAADLVLESSLRLAQRGGVCRSVLDQGDEVPELLQRFLASPHCDSVLSHYVKLLLARASQGGIGKEAGAGPAHLPTGGRQLTERETAVLKLAGTGLPNKEIARRLGISAETVKTHLAHCFQKLEVDNRTQAVRMARLYGLLP